MPLYDKLEICLVKAKPELSDLAPYESDLSISASDRMKLKKEFVATMTECVEVVLQRFLLFGRQPYSKNNELPEDCNFALITTEFDNTTYGDITWKIDDGGRLYDHFETGDKSWIDTKEAAEWGDYDTLLGRSYHAIQIPLHAVEFNISIGACWREEKLIPYTPELFKIDIVGRKEETWEEEDDGFPTFPPELEPGVYRSLEKSSSEESLDVKEEDASEDVKEEDAQTEPENATL